jgi:ABC-type bacteriocin/lantibiotic exporter with double-glycine peptidase domain
MNFNDYIELKGIVFRYSTGEVDVLKDVSFKIKKGETIVFVRSIGSGKSTFVDIMLGLLTPKAGTISADNVNVHDKLHEWQNLFGYVPQSIYLTDDTLR